MRLAARTMAGAERSEAEAPTRKLRRVTIKNPPSVRYRGGLTREATRFVAEVRPHPLEREPPCPGWQVGGGVSPTLNAARK